MPVEQSNEVTTKRRPGRPRKPASIDEAVTEALGVVQPSATVELPIEQVSLVPDEIIRDAATIRRDDFVKKVLANRNAKEPEYVLPVVPPQVAEQTRLEMEAGAAAVARATEQQKGRLVLPRDPSAGTMTSVYRPKDFIPDFNSKSLTSQTLRG